MQLNMGIIKIEVSLPEAVRAIEEFRNNRVRAFEAIAHDVRGAVGGAINQCKISPERDHLISNVRDHAIS